MPYIQRKPLIDIDDGFNPVDGIYDVDDGDYMGGTRRKKSRKTRRKVRGKRRSAVKSRRKKRGFLGIFRRRRRGRRPVRRRRRAVPKISRSKKGVKYTKNGQPYIILKSGKARFIKGRRH